MKPRTLPPQARTLMPNGKRPCRGCGGEVPKGRQTWCGDPCRDSHYMALSVYARRKVWARDKGVCAGCGCDTGLMERIARRLRYPLEDKAAFELLLRAWGLKVYVWAWVVPNLWEADHVVPLAEGGTHALENYRTLCVPCHKAETKALAGRRAAQRRQHRAPELPL